MKQGVIPVASSCEADVEEFSKTHKRIYHKEKGNRPSYHLFFLNVSMNTLNVSDQKSNFFIMSSVRSKLQGINILLSVA